MFFGTDFVIKKRRKKLALFVCIFYTVIYFADLYSVRCENGRYMYRNQQPHEV
jgi:hypothetical protein